MTKYIVLTVDAEAVPRRALHDPLEELIWGRFGGEEFGLGRLMDIADRYGVKISVYLDYCEYYLYGESLLDVAREVVRRGHDVQIHLHTNLLPPDFAKKFNLDRIPSLDQMNRECAQVMAACFSELAERATGKAPIAFRGSAFRFNRNVLEAFHDAGLRVSSNYHSGAKYWRRRQPHAKLFQWPNGMLELPLSTVHVNGEYKYLVFENFPVDSASELAEFTNRFYELPGEICILNHLFHSWSLLAKDENGCFTQRDEAKAAKAETFFANISALNLKAIVSDDIIALANPGVLPTITFEEVFDGPHDTEPDYRTYCDSVENRKMIQNELATQDAKPVTLRTVDAFPAVATSAKRCSICSAPEGKFADYSARYQVRCVSCGSLERHRILWSIYHQFVQHEFTFRDKDMLLLSPNPSELAWLKPLANVVTSDGRAEAKPDYVIDFCQMDPIADESFDVVIANHIFAHVYDDNRAFAEVWRVLRPQGRLFFTTPLTVSRRTQRIESIEEICKLWGREAYDKYRIGTFRRYGILDLLRQLQEKFVTTTYFGVDEVTGCRDVVFCCEKEL